MTYDGKGIIIKFCIYQVIYNGVQLMLAITNSIDIKKKVKRDVKKKGEVAVG